MKKTLFISAAVVLALAAGSAAVIAFGKTQAEEIPAGTETVEMEVEGMQTLLCEIGLEGALKEIEGVQAVTVDREAGLARVSYDPDRVSPAAFLRAASSVGFGATLPECCATDATASGAPSAAKAAEDGVTERLTTDEVEVVAAFVAEYIVEKEEIPEASIIEQATGVELSDGDKPILEMAVVRKLAADPRGQKLLEGSRCSDYGACSLWGDLSGASDDVLAMYERERALDGTTYDDRELPAFEAVALDGRSVSSRDLTGRPALVALLSVHCTHSMETFPILQDLHRRLAPEGVRVVGVLVNSGTVEDANTWVPHFAPEHPIWVVEDDALGDLIGSHLVPTYLLVDSDGEIVQMLVGFQEEARLIAALEGMESRLS